MPRSISLNRLVVGTAHLGLPLSPLSGSRAEFRYLDELVEAGLVTFDLAASYQAGGTERLFGRWLQRSRVRERLTLIGKAGHPLPLIAPHRLGRQALESDLRGSLKRLGTDYLDVLLLHRDDRVTPLEAIARTLASFLAQGAIRAWGVSNWTHQRLAALMEAGTGAGLPPPAASSPHLSPFGWEQPPWKGCVSISDDEPAQAWYREAGIPILAWSPLAAGFLREPTRNARVYGSPANLLRRARLLDLAAQLGLAPTEIALRYLQSLDLNVHPVVGSTNTLRMRQNARACEQALDPSEVEWLRSGLPDRNPKESRKP